MSRSQLSKDLDYHFIGSNFKRMLQTIFTVSIFILTSEAQGNCKGPKFISNCCGENSKADGLMEGVPKPGTRALLALLKETYQIPLKHCQLQKKLHVNIYFSTGQNYIDLCPKLEKANIPGKPVRFD